MSFAVGDRVITLVDIPLYEIRSGRAYESCVALGVVRNTRARRGVIKRIFGRGPSIMIDVAFPDLWPSDLVGRVGRFKDGELAHLSVVDILADLAE